MSEKPPEVIEVRAIRDRWEVFEIGGILPFYRQEKYALDYALIRAVLKKADIHVMDSGGAVERVIQLGTAEGQMR